MQKPFLKWAGGKSRLMGTLSQHLPQGERLVEPFVGAAAVFLNTCYPKALLADTNADLIYLYKLLQTSQTTFVDYCQTFFTDRNNTEEAYRDLRLTFNSTKDSALKSALFLYLNRHGYNGLCRYNSRGQFNVPFGRYTRPYFPQAEMHAFIERAQHAKFVCQDFKTTFNQLNPGDVVYCDPPYDPINQTASFTAYTANCFTADDQQALMQCSKLAAAQNIPVLISNHATPRMLSLHETARSIDIINVRRMISCNGSQRNHVEELLARY